jgi:transposase
MFYNIFILKYGGKNMDSLGIPEFEVMHIDVNEEYIKFTVKAKTNPFVCTECGSFIKDADNLKVHDTRPRIVADEDYRGKKVILEIQQRRFTCPHCRKRFTEVLRSVSPDLASPKIAGMAVDISPCLMPA